VRKKVTQRRKGAKAQRKTDVGAVVHCYDGGKAFEVEFVSGRDDTIGVLTLEEADIRPIGGKDVLHARELKQAAFG
jgi:hypothetical protein